MSVIKSKRTQSQTEYAMNFVKMYEMVCEHISKVPKRKQKYLCIPIINIINEIHSLIYRIFDRYYKYGIRANSVRMQSEIIIEKINSLQMPLLALWNIEHTDIDKMIRLIEMLNTEIRYIAVYGGIPEEDMVYMYIFDYKAVDKMEFLKTMSALHKVVYQKAIHLPAFCRNSKGSLLISSVDSALWHVCEANRNFPINQEIYQKRTEHLSTAISILKSMQVPLFSIFNLAHYNNKTMLEITTLLDTEIRLLTGLIKSDKERFSNLS